MSKGIGPYGVVMPFERCDEGEEYCAPGPCLTRQMTPEERKKYGPPRPVPIGVRINQEKARKARLAQEQREAQAKGDDQMPALSVEQDQDWRKTLTRDKYIELKRQGKNDLAIRQLCGIKYASDLTSWKKENGLKGVRLNNDGELVMPDAVADAEPSLSARTAQAANRLQAEIDASEVAPALDSGSSAQGMTVAEVLEMLPELNADIDCCRRLLDENQLTPNVALLVEKHYHDYAHKLDKVKNARVVI